MKCLQFLTDECAVCVLEDGTELEVTELMGLSFEETICGDGSCGIPENYRTCPEDCSSGGWDGYCDGVQDGRIDPDCTEGEDPDYGLPDPDGDGILDSHDNCPENHNPKQIDSDEDGVGDAGEPIGDLNNDNCTDRTDYYILMEAIRGGVFDNPTHDLNGDGLVNRANARTLVGVFTNPKGAPCP